MTGEPGISQLKKKIKELEKAAAEQALTEDALRESEKRYRAVVEDMPAMICRFLPDGRLTFVNSAFCTFYAQYSDDLIGQNFFELFPSETRDEVKNNYRPLDKATPMAVVEHRNVGQYGTLTWQEWTNRALFDENDQLVEYQSIGRDITEQKLAEDEGAKLERQIRQAQKIEAVGTLADGIANDFNNILSAVIGHCELSGLFLPKGSPAKKNLTKILDAAYHARDLVHLIELISIENEPQQKPVHLRQVMEDVLALIQASLPASIKIAQQLIDESDTVLCDPTQIHQVLTNLCTNAHHSMRETGGTLSVTLKAVELDNDDTAQYPELKPGAYARITVSDTGRGMDERTLERIFDPYFTTKEQHIGTGLGLAVARSIVKKYAGVILVSSDLGKGTTFTVYLPRQVDSIMNETEETNSVPPGQGRILFVDDEQALADLGSEMLKNLGYHTESFTNPIQAQEIFSRQPNDYDLVITDMTMPQMTGAQLSKNLLKIRKEIPIILCTGFNERISDDRAKKIGIKALEMKPLQMHELAATIRKVLDDTIH
jgi:PAS domain S-box-containing protein